MEFERKLILDEFEFLNETGYNLKLNTQLNVLFVKDTKRSINTRKEGNKLFKKKRHNAKDHEEIWKLYTYSIALALNGSEELAAGYANRSAILIHLKKYRECIQDIDMGLKITLLDSLKVKLFCRKTECCVALQEGKQRSSLEKAKYWLNKIDDADENKNALINMVKKAEIILEQNVPDYQKKDRKYGIQCTNTAVRIGYNEKYGRCLIATRDIRPGEFVCVEDFYVASMNNKKAYAYCSHCLGISWTTIPCDNCAFYMFCGEKCKDEAWQKYHDIECSTNTYVDNCFNYYIQLSIRSLIMGIKETGSIKNLRNLINDVEKNTDKRTRGFSQNGKFLSNSFRSLYSLCYSRSSELVDRHTRNAMKILIHLTQTTSLFGKNFVYRNTKELMKHEDVIFIGTLLLRLLLIFAVNAFNVMDLNTDCKKRQNLIKCGINSCCPRGMSLSPLTSLINHNCDNNVGKFYSNDGKVIYFATYPIKKDSQIFSAYYCTYLKVCKSERQRVLNNLFDFNCDCMPCKKNWPETNELAINIMQTNMISKEFMVGNMLMMKNEALLTSSKKRRRYNEKVLQEFIKDLEMLLKNVSQPSFFIQTFLMALNALVKGCYSTPLRVPKKCNKNIVG